MFWPIACVRNEPELPPLPREFRAAWVATVDNIDWPSKRTLTSDQQRAELIAIFDKAVNLNLNAIVLQVRPSADALYPSKIEPWSEYLTGKQGQPPNPAYDPLAFAVEEAHRRGLELHCWFNPYRAKHFVQKGPLAKTHIGVTHPDVVKSYGRYLWMDPGEPLVQKQSLDVIQDVVKRYDVDGIHIDDYFYPYPEGGQPFPDAPSYAKYTAGGGTLALDDWRRNNVDEFVRQMYQSVKRLKRWVKVGISPFGIFRPGNPTSVKTTFDQYAVLYADARKWLNEGWCDYYSPQLYWSAKSTTQNYGDLLGWWINENTQHRHIWPGNYTSRTGTEEGKPWAASEITDQIRITRALDHDGLLPPGNVHFSMKAFLQNWNGVTDAVRKLYTTPTFVPECPWLSAELPAPPRVVHVAVRGGWEIHWRAVPSAARYAINVKTTRWLGWKGTTATSQRIPTQPVTAIAVETVDRYGTASEATIIDVRR